MSYLPIVPDRPINPTTCTSAATPKPFSKRGSSHDSRKPFTPRAAAIRLFFAATILTSAAAGLQQQDFPQPPNCNRREALLGLGGIGAVATLSSSVPASPAHASSPATTTTIPTWHLGNQVEFPRLALNTAGLTTDGTERAFHNALQAGISHVEFHPGPERDGVSRVLQTIPRDSVFLTTKIETNWENDPTPETAASYVRTQLDRDLAILGVDHVDVLMLRESTDPHVVRAMWTEMEREYREGRVRSLGVVNYCEGALKSLLAGGGDVRIMPSVNYIQLHVGMGPMPRVRAFGESLGIKTFAHGHLGERASPPDDARVLQNDPTLRRIAKGRSRTIDETALRWILQNGAAASVRPTSDFRLGEMGGACVDPQCAEGLRAASAGGFGWELGSEEMEELNGLSSPGGNPTLFSSPGCPNSFFS